MKLQDFDYNLPAALIAQYPAAARDGSRLLAVDRASGRTEDRYFRDLPRYLRAGDVLVLNDSRVIRARLIGVKERTGGRIELFLLKRIAAQGSTDEPSPCVLAGDCWEVLARPAKRLRVGDRVTFGADAALTAAVLGRTEDGSLTVRFEYEGIFAEILERLGRVPLPPYIRRADEDQDAERYQTVYAAMPGSAAAPTAGLHFTERLLDEIRAQGVETVFVTLHVGLGTFRPVQSEDVLRHRMHTEEYFISEAAAAALVRAKREGRRVICVGTTSVRTIESAAARIGEISTQGGGAAGNTDEPSPCVVAGAGDTDIFIYPGYEFKMADGLITNFHLPKSTLLMLVSAFYDREKMLAVYRDAIEKGYRFFSYGDAMLIS